LTARPSKNIDLAKIDDIQEEFFGAEGEDGAKRETVTQESNASPKKISARKRGAEREARRPEKTIQTAKKNDVRQILAQELTEISAAPADSARSKKNTGTAQTETKSVLSENLKSKNLKIADLLATAQFDGVRHTSRPFTVPRSLTIDLNRLKSKFRSRNLQYTQNELIDKMLKESIETVTADNYFELREKAFEFVKSPEQSSRRSVTLTEETVSGMAELKADLALAHGRRFSADEIFTTLLAVAFAPLYEQSLI